jgi:iron complex transport system substrate-binding protein
VVIVVAAAAAIVPIKKSRMKRSVTPNRIVCLSAEVADWFWRIGAWEKVVGITAFFTIPPEAAAKPRIGGFSTAQYEEIADLKPDLVITFSDVQAPLFAELIRRGLNVFGTNQRTLAEMEATLALLGRIVGREMEAERCLKEMRKRLAPVPRVRLKKIRLRPRVYFEEWNDPLVSGIGWVSELIERAGGKDEFAELRAKRSASERIVTSDEICRRDPEIIFASWCGRRVQFADFMKRPGWNEISAVRNQRIYEIPSSDILQPGFRLVYGYERMKELLGP